MSKWAKTEILFGVQIIMELDESTIEQLTAKDLIVSPCYYCNDDFTNKYIIGELIQALDNVGHAKSVNFRKINESLAEAKIINILKEFNIPISPKESFTTYVNSYYY